MPDYYYKDAQKLAQKAYKAAAAAGENPYLPVLDALVSPEKSAHGKQLGLAYVPVDRIVGTKSEGRTNAFAPNFMPLLQENTEFAQKWEQLCHSHLEEGIRDPVKLYEYMNRYYVEEGNKRVSVLRFFGAVTIAAQVIRVLPEKTEDKDVLLYYEFVDFHALSQVNFLEFTRLGSYKEFQRFVGKAPKESWTDDDRARLSLVLHYFGKAYDACGGRKLASTVADALLAYAKVYGYQDLHTQSVYQIRANLQKIWEEVRLLQEDSPIDVRLTPPEEKKPGFFSVLTQPKRLNVAFVHDKTSETSGWTFGHEIGREQAQRVLMDRIDTHAYFCENSENHDACIAQAIADGNTVIFTTSPVLLPASLRAAVEHPEITLLNCSLGKPHRYIRTYYARMYEVKMIIGAIAGALAENEDVGYICDYPIYGQMAGINAFALGVAMVNPKAKVYLEWSGTGSVAEATKRLTRRGIRLISSQDIAKLQGIGQSSFGLYEISESGEKTMLVRPSWNWGAYYETLIRRILDCSIKEEYEESRLALNYYWGLSEGVVDVKHFGTLPEGVHRLSRMLKKGIRSGTCDPFRGPIHSQSGEEKLPAHTSFSPAQIIHMDWLVSNVVGIIPRYEQLTEIGRHTVDMMGVSPATQDAKPEDQTT